MHELVAGGGAAVTMTSLELVDFINSQRGAGEAELRHDHFMAKVPKVLGEGVPKFRDTYAEEGRRGCSVQAAAALGVRDALIVVSAGAAVSRNRFT